MYEEGAGDLGTLGFLEAEWGVRNRGCGRDLDAGGKMGKKGISFYKVLLHCEPGSPREQAPGTELGRHSCSSCGTCLMVRMQEKKNKKTNSGHEWKNVREEVGELLSS